VKRTVSSAEAGRDLGSVLQGVCERGDEVVIEQDGEVVGVVIPAHRYASLERDHDEFWRLFRSGQDR
jgi:prevent-host-death family protein